MSETRNSEAFEAETAALNAARRAQRASEARETALRSTLDAFKKQSKETYRRYEEYIESAESVCAFFARGFANALEALARAFEALALNRRTNLANAFGEFAVESAAAENALSKLSQSKNLSKKGLFVDARQRFWFDSTARLNAAQSAFDALLARGAAPARSALAALNESRAALCDDAADGLSAENVRAIAVSCEALLAELRQRVFGANDAGDGIDELVRRAQCRAEEMIGADGDALAALQSRNAQLRQLQSHIAAIAAENERLCAQIRLKDFSLIEQSAAIIASEENVKANERRLAERETALADARARVAALNDATAKALRLLFERNDEIERRASLAADLERSLALTETALAQRGLALAALTARCEQLQTSLERKNAELAALERTAEERQSAIDEKCERLFEDEQRVCDAERKAVSRVREEIRARFCNEFVSVN